VADRKASVALELKAGQFKAEATAAEAKVRDLDDAVDDLDRDITKIPADAAKAGAAMKLLGGEVKELGKNVDAVGDKSTALTLLDSRIRNTRAEVKKLTEEFEKTGDADIFTKLSRASSSLRGLTEIRKKVASSVEGGVKDGITKAGPEAAGTFAQLFQGGVIKALSNPYVAAAAAALAVAVAAPVGAAIGGAIIAAGSLGVVGAGVVGAAQQSKEVGAAWTAVIADIQTKWLGASKNFIDPLITGAGTVRKVLGDIRLDSMFARAATFVGPLSEAAAWFARNVINGVDALVQKGGPVIDVLRQELPEVGQAISAALTDIAGGNRGAADGLRDILNLVEQAIRYTGIFIRATEDIYHGFVTARDAVGDFFHYLDENVSHVFLLADKVSNFWPDADTQKHIYNLKQADDATKSLTASTGGLGIVALSAGENYQTLSKGISQAAQNADTLAAAMVSKIFGATLAVDQAAIGWNRSLLSLEETIGKNGRAIDRHTGQVAMNTKAGLDNRTAVLSAVQANMSQYQAFIAAGGSAVDAAAAYDSNTRALEKQLRQMGYNQQQIDGLIGKYKGIPRNVNTAIAMQGLTDAINGLADLIRLINHIPLSKTTVITTTYRTNGTPQQGHSRYQNELHGGIVHAADGLIMPPRNPGTVLFGEPATGGEAYIPLKGISQTRAMGLAQTVGNNYGFNVSAGSRRQQPLAVTIGFAGNTDGALATAFMKLVRIGKIQIGAS